MNEIKDQVLKLVEKFSPNDLTLGSPLHSASGFRKSEKMEEVYSDNLIDEMNIIKKHQQNILVNMKDIAFDLGLKVYEVAGWPDNLCGKIVRDSQQGGISGYPIFINGPHFEGRKRFTFSHEIAHFLLHKKEIGDGIADDALYGSGPIT